MSDGANQTTGTIVAPDGTIATRPTTVLSQGEAELLRKYKKFLAAHGIREAWYCQSCWDGERSDGMRVHVTEGQIVGECRCRMLFYQGSTF